MTSSSYTATLDMSTNRQSTVAFATLFTIVVVSYAVFATWMPMVYIWATYENLIGEWTQVYLFAFAATTAIVIAYRGDTNRRFFALLGVSCAYVVLEEVSWGQQLFGWASRAFFEDHNIQDETNIHNMLTGPVSSVAKDAIEYALAFILVIYGVLYPVCVQFGSGWAKSIGTLGLVVPPLYLVPFFLCTAYLELQPFSFNEAEPADSTATLRKLATAERRAGNRQAFDDALNRALDIDQSLQEVEPWRSSTQRSLYRTYRALRQYSQSRYHAGRAIELDVERLVKNPQDADAHYSLGKTYTLMGARDKAQISYKAALELRLAKSVDLRPLEQQL